MATKKDLVEAYSFSRRRLVTAFLSGAPGGREVEPARPGRTVVGGLALALLLVAGAAIASVLAGRTEEDWNKVGLVVNQQTSAQYVILQQSKHPTLIPVINVTSAQLILGSTLSPTYVDESVIEDQTPGEAIGILGAPQLLPQPSQFIEQGWTSCTDDGLGMSLDLSRGEHTSPERGRGALVKTVDTAAGTSAYYVIARSSSREGDAQRTYAYPVRKSGRLDTALNEIGLDAETDAVTVPSAWIDLFPLGGSLDARSFPIPDFGAAPPESVARYVPPGTTIGQYVDDGADSYFISDEGRVPLNRFALAVYKQTVWGKGKQRQSPTPVTGEVSTSLRGATEIYTDAHWPEAALQPVTGQLCAQLDLDPGQAPGVSLRGDPTSSAAASDDSTTADAPAFSIDRGQGAYVMVGDWNDTTSTSRVVIDPLGRLYTLIGADTTSKLGYDEVDPPLVPDSWTRLMAKGVALSTNAALCPPPLSYTSADPSADATADTAEGATPKCQAPPSSSQ